VKHKSEVIKEELKENDKKLAQKERVIANIIDLTNPIKKYGNSCTLCPHPDRKHYAKGMCNYCYHTQGRVK